MYRALDSRGASHRFSSTNDAVSPCKRVSHLVGLERRNVGVGTRNGGQKLDFKGQRSEMASPVISVGSGLTTFALRLLGRSKKVDIPLFYCLLRSRYHPLHIDDFSSGAASHREVGAGARQISLQRRAAGIIDKSRSNGPHRQSHFPNALTCLPRICALGI